MHTPLFSSSCVDREKLISVVHALSLDATAAWSGRRWCLGRLNHKRLCLWGPCTGKELVLGQARQPSPNAARAAAAWSGGHGDASPWVGPSWWQEGSAATCSWLSSSSSTSTCTGRHPRICSWTCYPVHHFDPIWVIVTFLWCYRIVFMEANSTR